MFSHHFTLGLKLTLIGVLLSGCAMMQSSHDLVEGINFERNGSDVAAPSNVYLHRTADGMNLHGELKRKSTGRGPIPGHLHVELIDPQGKLLKGADVDYRRHNKQSDHAHFSIPLPVSLQTGSTVRITHITIERNDFEDHPKWSDTSKH